MLLWTFTGQLSPPPNLSKQKAFLYNSPKSVNNPPQKALKKQRSGEYHDLFPPLAQQLDWSKSSVCFLLLLSPLSPLTFSTVFFLFIYYWPSCQWILLLTLYTSLATCLSAANLSCTATGTTAFSNSPTGSAPSSGSPSAGLWVQVINSCPIFPHSKRFIVPMYSPCFTVKETSSVFQSPNTAC